MELKPGYKQTETGLIPADWETPLIGSLASFTSGSGISVASLSPQSSDTPIPVYGGNGIAGFTAKALVHNPVVVVGRVGQKCGEVYLTDGPAWITDNALYPRVVHRSTDMRFLAMAMSMSGLNNLKNRNDLPLVTQSILHSVLIPLPPTEAEQRLIADTLTDVDSLVESLEQLLVKKRQIKQGAMHELLTGKKRLPGFTTNWENTHFGALGDVYGGLTGKTKQDFESGNARYITFMNVMANTVIDSEILQFVDVRHHESQNEVMRGDILFNGSSETPEEVGMAAYVSDAFDQVYLNSFCFGFRQHHPEAADGLFLAYYFRSQIGRELLKSLAQGAIRYNLSKTALLKLRFPLPSKPEQVSIAASLSDMDAEIAAVKSRITKARQIKQGMMQELLTGRIRLARRSAQVLSFPVKETASVAKVSHNTQINEAVVIAVLSAKFGSETFPLGRFRRTKFSYLLHRHVEHEASGFMKKAAGPYNPRTRYGGAEKIALHNRYVRILHTEKGEGFVAGENIAQAEGYFDKWYGAEALTWLEQFRYQKNDALELLTTVDMACEDLSRLGKAATLSAVKQIIHDSPEWKAKLNRAVFSDDNIATTIQSCGQLFPIDKE